MRSRNLLGTTAIPSSFCWTLVFHRVRSGERLFPTFYGTKVNNVAKAFLQKLRADRSSRYIPHGFRRGAASGLKTRGSQCSTVSTIGEWRSLSFLGYVDLADELDRDMPKLPSETDELESDLTEDVLTLGAAPHQISCVGPWAWGPETLDWAI